MPKTNRGYPYPDEFSELPGLREIPVLGDDLDEGDALEVLLEQVDGGRLIIRVDDPSIEDRTDDGNGRFTLVFPDEPGAVSGKNVLTTEHSIVVNRVVRLLAGMDL